MTTPRHLLRMTTTTLGECCWALVWLGASFAFVAVFVWLTARVPADGSLLVALQSPVNIARVLVLAATLWLWAYIARCTRAARTRRRADRARRQATGLGQAAILASPHDR